MRRSGEDELDIGVEDEAITAMYLSAYLERKGYLVLAPAATGEDAVQRPREERPDAILVDIMLGGELDGIDAARRILSEVDAGIVFMTGYPSEEIRERATGVPNIGFVSKPFNAPSLDAVIPACD